MAKVDIRDIIKAEIAKNGNTNLIANSGLPNDKQIFAVGDSHTIFFYNSMRIKEHWGFGGKIPLTVYTLLRDNLNIYEIGNILGNGHEKYNIKEGDYVIFFYGFNDIQRSIDIHARDSWEAEIETLFTNYIDLLNKFKNIYKINVIVSCIYPNPRPGAGNQNPSGSYQDRWKYCIKANTLLKSLCFKYSLIYFDIYDFITDSEGFIKIEFTKDLIHLDYDNESLREQVEQYILNLCTQDSDSQILIPRSQ